MSASIEDTQSCGCFMHCIIYLNNIHLSLHHLIPKNPLHCQMQRGISTQDREQESMRKK